MSSDNALCSSCGRKPLILKKSHSPRPLQHIIRWPLGISRMRYQNWDVLVFPDQCKIPLQEFKTACQVIQDPEPHSSQNNPLLLPTVTCFVPGLPTSAPFRISIHSWQHPEVSQYIQRLSKPSDHIIFEARLFIDGKIVGSKWFNDDGPWPSIIELSIDLNKHGEFEKLKFPAFHNELLSQSHWNPGDDLGRIKVVIAEGFARDNPTYPFERKKNIVSFSFQHAPLDVLETSSIAWPNAAMWRQVSLLTPYFVQQAPPGQMHDGVETHGHSPRRGPGSTRPVPSAINLGLFSPQNGTAILPPPIFDPFIEPDQPPLKFWRQSRQTSTADVSMPDYSKSNTWTNNSRHVTDPMVISDTEISDHRLESLQSAGAYESVCEALVPSVPVNTPAEPTPVAGRCGSSSKSPSSLRVEEPTEANFVGALIMNEIDGKKENCQQNTSPYSEVNSATNVTTLRKTMQSYSATSSGAKRQRILTPSATKVIDVKDEPGTSPLSRKVSRGTFQEGDSEGEKKVLREIENIR